MRRTLFCTLVSVAAFAFVPASALARQHQGERHHHKHHHHHARIHHERFGTVGSTGSGSSGSGGMPSSDTAGTIASFDGTKLTITLNDRSTVSGTINNDTEIGCMSSMASGENFRRDDRGGEGNGGDQGDDNGDQGDDRSDNDDGNQNCTTADLKPGATVTGAELKISSAGAVWDKVELA